MEKLKNQIIKLCNESDLPLEAIVFILKDAYRDSQEAFQAWKEQQIKNEKAQKIKDALDNKSTEKVEVEEIDN